MTTRITIEQYCNYYQVRPDFLQMLADAGLFDIGETEMISDEQFEILNCYRRMHYDLQINIEGIETISHLLERHRELQKEVSLLKSRLRLYE